jgi:hypothetical protein
MKNYDPQIEGLINEARAITCEEWAKRRGWKMKRSGSNMYGPCPKCGGTDRFAIEAKQDKWFCRGCGVGGHDAISMVRLIDNSSLNGGKFMEACEFMTGRTSKQILSQKELEERENEMMEKRKRQEKESEKRRQEAREMAHKLWKRCAPAGKYIADYLKIRGLETDPGRLLNSYGPGTPYSSIREIASLGYWHDHKEIYTGPAMVLAIQWSDNRFGGAHRTWLDLSATGKKGKAVIISDGEALDAKKVLGSKGNGAIRLYTPSNARRIVMGEGFETTLTPYVHAFDPHTAYWAGLDIGHIAGRAARDKDTGKRLPRQPDLSDRKCFIVPEWCEELILILDGDSDKTATRNSLIRAANRQKLLKPGISVKCANPGNDLDMNDLVMVDS